MSRPADQSTRERRRRRPWAAALIALTLGRLRRDVRRGEPRTQRGDTRVGGRHPFIPAADAVVVPAGGGRRLTEAQARGCLRQAWDAWLRELRRNGYDPSQVGRGR